jgi:LysR family nitrogen assimilation transcriptional regulator
LALYLHYIEAQFTISKCGCDNLTAISSSSIAACPRPTSGGIGPLTLIDLRQLRYFVAIVDSGSLTRAAGVLHIAQPALSQQMSALESELDSQLLTRSVKGVRPTEAGWAVYRHAQTVLKLTMQTRDVAHGAGADVSGRVRVGMPSSIAMILAAPLLASVRILYPSILVEIYESPSAYLAAQLLDERVDLSLLVDKIPLSRLSVQPLVVEGLYFVRSQRGGNNTSAPVGIEELSGVPMILTTRATTLRHLVDQAFAEKGLVAQVVAEASSIQTLLTVVAQAELGTLIPFSALSWLPLRAGLDIRPLATPIWRPVSLAWSRNEAPTQATERIRAEIIEVVDRLVRSGTWKGLKQGDVIDT